MTSARSQRPLPLIALALFAAAATAQSSTHLEHLSVREPRPLAGLTRQLELRAGSRVTYEDPAWAYLGDLKDVTDEVAKDPVRARLEGTKVIVPTPEAIETSYEADSTGAPVDLAKAVRDAVDAHNAAGNPGRFRSFEDADGIHVVPESVRDAAGQWRPVSPVLDAKIDLPAEQRTWFATVNAVFEAASRVTGARIFPFAFANHDMMTLKVIESAHDEPARRTLARVLDRFPEKTTWQCLYDPQDHRYVCNLRPFRKQPNPASH